MRFCDLARHVRPLVSGHRRVVRDGNCVLHETYKVGLREFLVAAVADAEQDSPQSVAASDMAPWLPWSPLLSEEESEAVSPPRRVVVLPHGQRIVEQLSAQPDATAAGLVVCLSRVDAESAEMAVELGLCDRVLRISIDTPVVAVACLYGNMHAAPHLSLRSEMSGVVVSDPTWHRDTAVLVSSARMAATSCPCGRSGHVRLSDEWQSLSLMSATEEPVAAATLCDVVAKYVEGRSVLSYTRPGSLELTVTEQHPEAAMVEMTEQLLSLRFALRVRTGNISGETPPIQA